MNMNKRPISLAFRVLLLVGLSIFICFLLLGNVIQRSIAQHFSEQNAEELQVIADAVKNVILADNNQGLLPIQLKSAVAGHHGIYFAVYESTPAPAPADGMLSHKLIYMTPELDVSDFANQISISSQISAENLSSWQNGEHHYQGIAMSVRNASLNREFKIVLAATMEFHLAFMVTFQKTLWAIMTIACSITLLAAWLAVRVGLQPLHKISSEIQNINAKQLHRRLGLEDTPLELIELVTSFNDMVERIEDDYQRLSNYSADIAHELRTPITNLSTQTQVALNQARGVDEYREVLYSALEEYDHITKMVSDMLWLAKSDNGLIPTEPVELNIADEITELFDFFEAWTEEKSIQLNLIGNGPTVKGDRVLLRRALNNILSNSIRHTDIRQTITVKLSSAVNHVKIEISNPGDTIPAEHLDRLFDRFYRTDPARKRDGDGVGLGLAIVKSIITAHRGTIKAKSENQLTTFEILLPV